MQLGIFAKTFAGNDPATVMQAAAAAGFATVQYNMACSGVGALPAQVAPAIAVAVGQAAEQSGVSVAAISATYNMIHPDMAVRLAGRGSFAAIAERAHAMGAGLVTVCTGSCDAADQWRHHPDNQSEAAWSALLAEFGYLIDVADGLDLTIGVEPELANVVNSAHAARRLIDTLGSDRIRIVMDAANLFEVETAARQRYLIDTAIDLLADRIALAHAKDRNADGSVATAGKGVIDFPQYLTALTRAGFDGALVTHGLTAEEAPGVAAFLRDTLAAIG